MLFSVLGPVDLTVGTQSIDLGPAKQRAVLAALLIDRDRPVPIEVLIDRVWGDEPPADVRNLVYSYIARLRRKLASTAPAGVPAPELARVVGGYCLRTAPETVDLHRFRKLLENSRDLDECDPARSALLGRANGLWRGIPLSGIGGRWATAMRHSLQQLQHEALVEWADVAVRLGTPRAVIDPLRQAYVENPLAESVAAHLMRALHADGRTSEALQLFEGVRRHLSTEIGTDPGSALRAAHDIVLRTQAATARAIPDASVKSTPAPAPEFAPETEFHSANMLPIDLPDFTGRDETVAALLRALTPGTGPLVPSVAVLHGPAGVGKTTTAVHAAYRLRQFFPSGQLYIDLGGSSAEPVEPYQVLERFLRALGVADSMIPSGFAERAEMYRALLAHSRTLVVLDDASGEPQVAPLLPGTGHCGVIITCRVRPAVPHGVPVLPVGPLTAPESVALLRRLVGERMDREPEAADELLALCAGSPLLLRIVGGRMMVRQHWTLARLLTRLRDDDRLLAELTDGTHDARTGIEEGFRSVDRTAQQFFLDLAAAGCDRWPLHAVARELGVGEAEADRQLERLTDVHLVTTAGSGADERYTVPRLHRLFARDLAGRVPAASLGVVGL